MKKCFFQKYMFWYEINFFLNSGINHRADESQAYCLPLTNSIYLFFLPLEMQRKLKQTKVYHTFFNFVWKETTHKPLIKIATPKSPVCMLLVKLASMNVFYSMWLLEGITFHKSLSFVWGNFNHYVDGFFEASVLKEGRILCIISIITVRC